MIFLRFSMLLILIASLASCQNRKENYVSVTDLRTIYSSTDTTQWPAPHLDPSIDTENFEDIGSLPKMKFPDNNPYSKEKKELGKLLFFDRRLSGSGQIACASCHNPELAWTDNITRSFGHNREGGKRNAMTIINSGYAKKLFWDGRGHSLEHQVMFPILDSLEMNAHVPIVIKRIEKIKGYERLFENAFGTKEISIQNIQKAIATFERTINSPKSRFDRFIEGNPKALSDNEVLGLHLFRTKARCINCHNTPYFSDQKFHNDGQTLFGSKFEDFGLYEVTGDKSDIGKFKTPTLREVSRTGPWMHHGHFPSMLDVLQFYNLGNPAPIQKKYLGTPRDSLLPEASTLLKPLQLTNNEIQAIIAFIETLETPVRRMSQPVLP